MSLSVAQRLHRLDARIAEILCWRERETEPIADWRCDGRPLSLGDPWPPHDAPVVFTAAAEVPAHWPLGEARLRLDVGGESLLTLDEDGFGPASFGLDPNHQEFPLQARRVRIETESVPRLPFGEPVHHPRLAEARLVWVDLAVHRLALLLRQVWETAQALEDHEVVPHLVAAAETALWSLEWPSATGSYLGRTAPLPQQQKIWRLPALEARPAALGEAERQSVVAAHDGLVAALQALQQRFPPQGRLAITGHAHIDLAWLWPYAETRRKARRTFHTALRLMEQFPDFVFNQSTAAYYAQIEQDDPALFTAIRARVAEGRWETIGGLWVEPDTNMPTGESLARQVLYGQRYFEQAFGVRHSVCWLPDCFGFSAALPQLLRQGGIDSFFTIKVNWSETNRFPHDLFHWEGLDGSRVLAHTFDNPIQGYNGTIRADCVLPTWRNFRGKTVHDESLLAIGFGDGGGGVTPEMLERQAQLADFPALPALRPARVEEFYARIRQRAAVEELPVWLGEIYLELHRATLTSQGRTKRLNRQAERALLAAESVGSLAVLLGAPRFASLEPAWRGLLKNQFHDILPGSSIREVYEDAERELTAARDAGLDRQAEAMRALAATLPAGGTADALVVVNPDLSPRPLRLELEGEAIAPDLTVPPLGIVVLDRAALRPAPGLSASWSTTGSRLENRFLRVEIGADGTIARLLHKPGGRDALAGRGNQLWLYPADKPRSWDAWDVEADYDRQGFELTGLEESELVEDGPDRAALRLVRRYRDSTITQTLTLWANSPRLDIHARLDWHDRRVLLRALVPVAVRAETASFECAFGVVRRPTHRNTSWDQAKFEVPGHRFADLSEPGFGVALLNDGKYGHSALGNVLGLSLLRAPIYPDPLADEGVQEFTYAILPHEGDWHEGGVREAAEDLNQPLLALPARNLAAGLHTPLMVSGIKAGLAAFKPAEEGEDLVLRLYEPAGGRGSLAITLPESWQLGEAVTLLEEPAGRDRAHDLEPFEVRSWRVRAAR
ncbi:alpha-mannosidase [Inquilinus ginsengisoli]|uniref:Alpha-mannosidase n=1 Tax=Inquilinus ginsengisoli TaxID=363840 RepID=A0ABU1JQU5_9PROT|nr:glycoside hydrolase family 38 C-terminal domain-containing protein [Inquilinus ginsengisoli]MDR6290678.1 alpha-mannosidase [Inquilinus ginsengisoli]